MRGRRPKPPHLRARTNRSATHAMLPSAAVTAKNDVPPLPERDKKSEVWHPKVKAWWASVWRSPMSAEYLDSDIRGGLHMLAELYQQLWGGESKDVARLAAEIRQQEVRFGLSPIDRHRLQWEVDKGEQAGERTTRRRALRSVEGKDPRQVLKVAK